MRSIGLVLACILLATSVFAQQLKVAAAADLQYALQDLSGKFEKATGISLQVTYGSSGNFATQIQSGAPFDVYLSADVQYPEKLLSEGFAEPGSLYRYAVGTLVIWAPNGSKLDLNKGLSSLTDSAIQKIAIANPQHAPYGRAAVAAFKSAGIYEEIEHKLVFGENISQAAQFLESGNADAGLIALSLAISPMIKSRGHFVEVPKDSYTAIEQAAVIVKSSKQKDAAGKFLAYLKSADARATLRTYGFSEPVR